MKQNKVKEIKDLYYNSTENTIERDLKLAVEFFKTLPSENTRAKAAVYMDGLSQMRSEWRLIKQSKRQRAKKRAPKKEAKKLNR